ncbi:Clp protease N-terminal domain-containing protein [Phytohabitans sp. LJ34]|uniref:ClpX C4-type zinc finger protein n=1 Tax=Phytohabitans sp. LJ34 TaxID=3452217 RepID=UPI003F888531
MAGVSLDDLIAQVHRAAGADHLNRVEAAVGLAGGLSERADALVDHVVGEARRAGVSWTEIGGRLGVSKQAARKRFTERPPTPVLAANVVVRPRLRTCLDRAHEVAAAEQAGQVGTHHLLAGLLAEGVAAAVLDQIGVTAAAFQESSSRLFGPPAPGDGPPMLSPEAVCAIEAAAHHAQATAADPDRVEVGTEHLLLVLAFDPGSRARRVLVDLGADIAVIKKELACHLTLNPRRIGWRGKRRRGPACSFCGAAESAGQPLVHGPGVAICGTCTARSAQALERRTA